MAPSRKAKASGVSSSSFFDLQAEIAKHEADFAKNKASGQTTLVGGVKRPDKVCAAFMSVSRQRSESVAYTPHRSRRNG